MLPNSDPGRGPAVVRDADRVPVALSGAAVAIGNFDGVHRGHQALIAAAGRMAAPAARPVGIVTFDPHPRAFFRPGAPDFRLTPDATKLAVLGRFGVDVVFLRRFDAALAGTTAAGFVDLLARDLGVSAVAVGENFRFGRGREGSPDLLRTLAAEAGLGCAVVPPVTDAGVPVSSSQIRDALARGDVGAANRLLGYRWFVSGPVIHGEKRGRTLGFPTANLRLPEGCRLAHGIYAVRVAVGPGDVRAGVASFGRRPTFDDGAPLLETFLFDFAGDLYGRTIDVELVGWIRGEERFASAEALVARMKVDAEVARGLVAAAEGRALLG